MKLILDPNFFRDIRTIRLQRQVNDAQHEYFFKFLYPLTRSLGLWLIYEVDDVIGFEDIPQYNHGKDAYENKKFFHNVREMLAAVDLMTVTTEELKQYYVDKFQVDAAKIIVIPNYLPKWWIGAAYDQDRSVKRMVENIKKPRIGIPLSTSHYDVGGKNGFKDDLTEISSFIRSTHRKYQWCFIGHVPHQLEDMARDKLIEVQKGSDILNYPHEMVDRNFQVVVAPLQDNIFNRCKSNIKLTENWALGIPVIAQNVKCYDKYTDSLFKDNNELQNQLDNLFRDKQKYSKTIRNNRHIIEHGDKYSPAGYWLEKNLNVWYSLFTMPQKTLLLDITKGMNTASTPNQKITANDNEFEQININL